MTISASKTPYRIGFHLSSVLPYQRPRYPERPLTTVNDGLQRNQLALWKVSRVVKHIEQNLENTILTLELATLAGLSVFHFTRVFRNAVGCSPHIYVMRRRVALAQSLLQSTDISLAQISSLCGMSDQAHLNKRFRQFVGQTPGAWRRAQLSATPRAL